MALSDLTKRVVFKTVSGLTGEEVVAIMVPSPEFLENHTIEDVAATLEPGTKYKIVDTTDKDINDFLSDHTFRDAWEVDEEYLDTGVGEGAYFGKSEND